MKLRTRILLGCSLLAVCLCHGCGHREYADLESFTEQYLRIMQAYKAAMDRADSAQAVAAAIDLREDGLRKLFPEKQRMAEKYPEFFQDRGWSYDHPSGEIQRADGNMAEAARLVHHAEIKLQRYSSDPEVKEAFARMFMEWDQ